MILERNEGLQYQYKQILSKQLDPSNEVYSDFIQKMMDHNRTTLNEQTLFPKSLPQRQRTELFHSNNFTFEKLIQVIEDAKLKHVGYSEPNRGNLLYEMSEKLGQSHSVR
jgi:hypothetical protein